MYAYSILFFSTIACIGDGWSSDKPREATLARAGSSGDSLDHDFVERASGISASSRTPVLFPFTYVCNATLCRWCCWILLRLLHVYRYSSQWLASRLYSGRPVYPGWRCLLWHSDKRSVFFLSSTYFSSSFLSFRSCPRCSIVERRCASRYSRFIRLTNGVNLNAVRNVRR